MDIGPIIPSLRYENALAAIEFLETAFGFERTAVYADGDTVHHAELRFGNSYLMLGSASAGEAFGMKTPREVGGASTVWIYVVVPDADAHYARARAAGAEIVREISAPEYGGREYAARDLEGNLWSFGTYQPGTEPPA